LVATVGNTLGALTTWWLGVWAAKKYPAENLLSDKQRKSLQTVRNWGSWALLFSWLPLVGDGLCFAGGWLKLSLLSSLLAIFLGKALRYIAVAYAFI
jgi:membrane protein YqaA with SNARE-associated domain